MIAIALQTEIIINSNLVAILLQQWYTHMNKLNILVD